MQFPLVLGVSARHAHLCREHMDILFGAGSELHVKKKIGQPGQYASEEQITLVTPKGEMKLRIIGPLRPETQIAQPHQKAVIVMLYLSTAALIFSASSSVQRVGSQEIS